MTAPKPMKFAKPALMEWDGNKITDHNRSELGISVERIENSRRMANGTLRKYVIADKKTFSVSWANVPDKRLYTVDGYWGGRDIENFYNNLSGPFILRLFDGSGKIESFNVMMVSFSKSISKRGAFDFWQVDVEMEEV